MSKRNKLSTVPLIDGDCGRKYDFPYTPKPPLPSHGAIFIVGSPGSGKTSLLTSLLLSHKTKKHPNHPKYYYRYYDNVYVISGSLQTLPIKEFGLKEDHVFDCYSEGTMEKILEQEKEEDNGNSLIIIDDCIDSLKKSSVLTHTVYNRRHITQNDKDKTRAGLSIWVTSQKYNMLPLRYRSNMSHLIIYPTSNHSELKAIKDELLGDLSKDEQDRVLAEAWSEPYSFLFVDAFGPQGKRLYARFDLMKLE
jgi:GTPase SAR1 family protein